MTLCEGGEIGFARLDENPEMRCHFCEEGKEQGGGRNTERQEWDNSGRFSGKTRT